MMIIMEIGWKHDWGNSEVKEVHMRVVLAKIDRCNYNVNKVVTDSSNKGSKLFSC